MTERAVRDRIDQAQAVEPPADDLKLADELRNDMGNARRLIARHGRDLLHVPNIGWHVWDGQRFNPEDGEAAALRKCQATAIAIFAEARAMPPFAEPEPPQRTPEHGKWAARNAAHDYRISAHHKWGVSSGNSGRLSAMLDVARPHLLVSRAALDCNPLKLNLLNGTLQLGIGRDLMLLPADRSDRITRLAQAAYDPQARAPKWQEFVEQVLPEDEVRGFVQRLFGYALTGLTAEQIITYLEGTGANGKSTLIEVICRVLGDYAQNVPIETFLFQDRKRGSDASPDVARLKGARLVRASEPEPGARLSESLIKQITGGEKLSARKLYQDLFDFDPQFKLVLTLNVRPLIRGKDHAIRRRIKVVAFSQTFAPAARPRGLTLVDELYAERDGILNWLLDGCEQYLEGGLNVPAVVEANTESYFADQDPVGQCVAETCERVDGETIRASKFYAAYKLWCAEMGEEPKSQTSVGRRLNDMKIPRARSSGLFYVGLRLRPDWEEMLRAAQHSSSSPPAS